jgi:TMEM199 family protein
MVEAIRFCDANRVKGWPAEEVEGEPSLDAPQIGKPISHGQVIELSKALRDHLGQSPEGGASDRVSCELADLLRHSQVYFDPPEPKPEPVSI